MDGTLERKVHFDASLCVRFHRKTLEFKALVRSYTKVIRSDQIPGVAQDVTKCDAENLGRWNRRRLG